MHDWQCLQVVGRPPQALGISLYGCNLNSLKSVPVNISSLQVPLHCDAVFLVATIVNDARNQIDIYGEDIEVDYRGYEVCRHDLGSWLPDHVGAYTQGCHIPYIMEACMLFSVGSTHMD